MDIIHPLVLIQLKRKSFMILSNFYMLIKVQIVLIIFISVLLITTNRKGSVVSVTKGGLGRIVIKLFAIQI